jgi:hypothetical protein
MHNAVTSLARAALDSFTIAGFVIFPIAFRGSAAIMRSLGGMLYEASLSPKAFNI